MQEIRIGRLGTGFVVTWFENGARRRYRLKASSRKEAESEGVDVYQRQTAKVSDQTVKSLWEAYRREKDGRRVAVAMKYEWKAIGPHFGHLRHDQITIDLCRSFTASRRAAGKNDGTIWTELGHLRTVLIWAHQRRLIDYAPAIERPQKPAPKDRWMTESEIQTFMDAPAAHHIDLACILMLSTGARVTAVLELTWDRVDFENGIIDLRVSAKGPRKGRAAVPMNSWARAALSHARKLALTDYVIEYAMKPVKSIKKGFGLKASASGVEGITPHVLRHTAAVHLVSKGVSMAKVSQYLGHSNTSVTERVYGRFAPDHLRDEAEILNFSAFKKQAL